MGLDVIQFLHNKTLLVTGATGFLAKVFLEKVLRIQPDVKKIYLLIRAEDTDSASKRVHEEILQTKLFNHTTQNMDGRMEGILKKVIPIPGDVSCDNIGIDNIELRKEMWKEVEIIVSAAATTTFDEKYDVALAINTFGIYHLTNFVKNCVKVKVFLHISTAYVCGEREGIIMENAFRMGETLNGFNNLDINFEKQLAEETLSDLRSKNVPEKEMKMSMKNLGLQRAKIHGWSNTYSFTKAMGEMLLERLKEDLPVVILRPSIITSTYKDPFPGWREKFRGIDGIAIPFAKGTLKCFLAEPNTIVDVIPADMVANVMIVTLTFHACTTPSSHCRNIIYHVGSSSSNPLQFANLIFLLEGYLKEHPWVDENGKFVRAGRLKVVNSMNNFHTYLNNHYFPLLKTLEWASSTLYPELKGSYDKLKKEVDVAIQLSDLHKPYALFKGIFDDSNLRALTIIAKKEGVDIENLFNFDPKSICWEAYFMKIHFPGTIRSLQSKL